MSPTSGQYPFMGVIVPILVFAYEVHRERFCESRVSKTRLGGTEVCGKPKVGRSSEMGASPEITMSYVLLDYCSLVLLLISSQPLADEVCDVHRF